MPSLKRPADTCLRPSMRPGSPNSSHIAAIASPSGVSADARRDRRALDLPIDSGILAAMLPGEAVRLREILLGQDAVSPLLNLGSSTRHFRDVVQPYIEEE